MTCLLCTVLLLTACASTDETIDVNTWRDRLKQPSQSESTIGEEIGSEIKDAADKVADSAPKITNEVSGAIAEGKEEAKNNISHAADEVNKLLGEEKDQARDSFLEGLGKAIANTLRAWEKEGADEVQTESEEPNNNLDGSNTEDVPLPIPPSKKMPQKVTRTASPLNSCGW